MPAPPPVPDDLVLRFGEPELVCGPAARSRTLSSVVGGLLVLLGLASFGLAVAAWPQPPVPKGTRGVYALLAAGLLAVGGVAVSLPWSVPAAWVCVCPRGILRHGRGGW